MILNCLASLGFNLQRQSGPHDHHHHLAPHGIASSFANAVAADMEEDVDSETDEPEVCILSI